MAFENVRIGGRRHGLSLRSVLATLLALGLVAGVVITALRSPAWLLQILNWPWLSFWVVWIGGTLLVVWLVIWQDIGGGRKHRATAVQNVLIAAGLLVMLSGAFYSIELNFQLHRANTTVSAEIVAIGLLAAGMVVGFLFGLPKVSDPPSTPSTRPTLPTGAPSTWEPNAPPSDPSRLRPNTNLEKVSDWLTTVITGLALTQLRTVPDRVHDLAVYLGANLQNGNATDHAIEVTALGIILQFPLNGFLIGYITTRLILTRAFNAADQSLFSSDVRDKVDIKLALFQGEYGGFGSGQPSPGDRQAAQRVVSVDPLDLVTSEEKATFARAQAILGNYDLAIAWYQAALILDPSNARLLEQYAAALYAKDDIEAFQILPPLEKALELTDHDSDATDYARIATNIAFVYLYVAPDGYVESLRRATALIIDPRIDKKPALFLYRACAYGQLFKAVSDGRTFGPNEVDTTDLNEITKRIVSDTKTALAMQPTLEPSFYACATGTGSILGDGADDDDLKAFTDAHPEYLTLLASYTTPPASIGPI